MIIKKNEEIAKKFIIEFGNYGINIDNLFQMHSNKLIEVRKKYKETGTRPNKVEIDEIFDRQNEEIKRLYEQNEPVKQAIISTLKTFSQDMLVYLCQITTNKNLLELISSQIKSNSYKIDTWNSLYMESGVIFEILNSISLEEKQDLLSLRGTDEKLEFNGQELIKLSPIVKRYILKSEYDDLSNEKKMFCIEHGFLSEAEFQFHKKSILNYEKIKLSTQMQEILNDLLDIQDSSIVDKTFDSLDKTTFIVTSKKI